MVFADLVFFSTPKIAMRTPERQFEEKLIDKFLSLKYENRADKRNKKG